MAELLNKLQELRNLPSELHWFCQLQDAPLIAPDNQTPSHEDVSQLKIEDADGEKVLHRRMLVTDCLQLYGYDGEDVLPHQRFLEQQIDRQLGKCDTCIVEYYKAKHQAMEVLRSEYDEEEVATLAKIFDDRDIDRIKRGLENATHILRAAAPEKRGKDILAVSSQLSLFEALSCQAFLKNPSLIHQYLDEPFRLIQTNKRLVLAHYVPAATSFLFDSSRERCLWAMQVWAKYRSPLRKEDFDFAIRDSLLQNLKVASEPTTDFSFVQRLWYGIRQIIDKLDNNLVTHSLRAIEVDIFRVALEHLQFNTAALRYLMQTMQRLLEIAPKDYWESMGPISPTTVIEQVFNNPQYDKFITEASKDENFETCALKDMLSWIKPFLESLQTGHQAQACRSLTFQLLDRLQVQRFPSYARFKCYLTGLDVLSWTLGNCNKEDRMSKPVGRIVAAETLQVANTYMKQILDIPQISTNDDESTRLVESCLRVVKVALALECKSLRTDQETLRQKRGIHPGFGSYSANIWDEVVKHLNRGNVIVARAALTGIYDLTGLEKFKINSDENYTEEKSKFNTIFGQLTHLVCQILERINDFNPRDLEELFHHADTATALVAALFSPDASTYEAGINLVKSISSESARREAIGHLLLPFFSTTLNSFSWSIRRVANNKSFASCPRMLTTCRDVVDVLCDSQTGLLRTRTLSDSSEIKAVESFWEHQWQALRAIYEMTEEWSKMKVSDPATMKEFCRNTMQFSEHFFDQYSVFAGAVDSAVFTRRDNETGKENRDSAGQKLLRHPAKSLEAMVKWLKLRDVYLAGTAVQLTKKVLDRLTECEMKVAEVLSQYLEHIIQSSPQGRTRLKPQEKAELARALEANLGRSISPDDTDIEQFERLDIRLVPTTGRSPNLSQRLSPLGRNRRSKSSTIDLANWRSKAKDHQKPINNSYDDELGSDNIDQEILANSRSVELLKEQKDRSNTVAVNSLRTTLLKSDNRDFRGIKNENRLDIDQVSFREKREQEKEAKRKRDSNAVLLLKKTANKVGTEQVIGEGSALSNIGVKGKDHTPKVSSMMVSSGSESETDDELDHALFGKSTTGSKMSDAVRDYQSNRLKQAKQQGPIKKMRQIRSAKDMRARLAPDLTSLHKNILSWDFFHEGDFPPGSARQDYSLVTNKFRNPIDYQNTFESLLVLEAWQGFLKSKEEGSFKSFEVKIANRLTVDSFIEVSTSMPTAEGKEMGISEADVILLSKAHSPTTEANQPHCFARVFKISRKKNSIDIAYRVNVGNNLVPLMVPNATVRGVKIQSLTPLEREYGALVGLKYFDLCDEIIKAKPSPMLDYPEKQLAHIASIYKINHAQAKAVKSAIDNDAFTLVQGPPGSGKTKTIVAIVGALLTDSFVDKGVSITRPETSERRQVNRSAAKKLLVCAPSNAAVDELVMRFKEGIKTIDGHFQRLSVVRLGRSDAINANVLDVTLEELVNAKLNLGKGKKTGSGEDVHQIMMAHKSTCDELNAIRASIDQNKANGLALLPEQEREFDLLKRKKQQLSNKIDITRDSGDIIARDAEINRRKIQQEVFDNAHVLCATLSGSGHEMLQNLNIEFETVVIDEAAQSIELSALIPLKYGCSKCILVGDPKQLPPTVLSREAARFQYEQSLFVRMQANHPDDVHLLNTQYRMHPEISRFPSSAFYDGKLLDGEDMAQLRKKPWHQSEILGAYRFFDVQGTHQTAQRGHSLINLAEIEVALKLFNRLITDCRSYDFKGKIGIITPYKSQLREIRSRFAQRYGESVLTTVEFNTTDAFQGRESEVIIFSCVRASVTGGIGFLSDIRRMNVGITRAKSSLWVLGNSQSLMKGEFWGRLIQDAKSRDRYTDGDIIELLAKPLLESSSNAGTLRRSLSTSNTMPSTNNDYDMQDAPRASGPAIVKSHEQTAKLSPIDQIMGGSPFDDVATNILPPERGNVADLANCRPSGGYNGLNSNANCQKCGSFKHRTYQCDNEDAKALRNDRCYRCGDTNHHATQCTIKCCVDCGTFGHSKETCTSSQTLSKRAKERIIKSEADHKSLLRRMPDIQRKKQLGEHAREVPKVQIASETPLPKHVVKKSFGDPPQSAPKRKRENSLPENAKRSTDMISRTSNDTLINNDREPPTNGASMRTASDRLNVLKIASRDNDDEIVNKSSAQGTALLNSVESIRPFNHNIQSPLTRAHHSSNLDSTINRPQDEAQSVSKDENGPTLPKKPHPSQNHTGLPAKKRKQVNPFIMPKDKRPRR